MLGDAYRDGWREQRVSYGYDRLPPDQNSPKMRVGKTMDAFVGGFERIPLIIMACVAGVRDTAYLGGAPAIFPACQNLLLAARALGYGGVMTSWNLLVDAELHALLSIPDDVFVAAAITLGRPQGHQGPVRRRPLGELVYFDEWGGTAPFATDPPGTRYTSAGPPPSRG